MAKSVALVTGAGQNVGRAIALQLSKREDVVVAVNDYYLDRAEQVVDEIRSQGGEALAVQADVSDYGSVKQMFVKIEADAGPVDVLVNNAGNAGVNPDANARRPFYETDPQVWKSWIGVNFNGVINCTALALPKMIESKCGKIVTIISDASRYGDVGLAIYAGAKAGAAGFMRSVAREMGRYNINANCVAIAGMNTPMIQKRLDADPERKKKMMKNYIIRRLGEPDDVAQMVDFLTSSRSTWITGQVYPVNGGFTLAL